MDTATELLNKRCIADCGDELETMLNWLDAVRESGKINMFGAAPELERWFCMSSRRLASDVLQHWMQTFAERHALR